MSLSIARCRSLLGPDSKLSDTQVEQLRQDLYALANAALENFRHREKYDDTAGQSPPPSHHKTSVPSTIFLLPGADRYMLQERAAILEFEARLNRQDAERQVLLEWAEQATTRQQAKSRKRPKKPSNNSCELR